MLLNKAVLALIIGALGGIALGQTPPAAPTTESLPGAPGKLESVTQDPAAPNALPGSQPTASGDAKTAAALEALTATVETLGKNLTVVTGDEQIKLVLGGALTADFYYNHARPIAPGIPFLLFNMALELQPNVDALFLSKLAPVEVMGWYGVSRRLVCALLMPSTVLIGALYPTLCRLRATDQQGFNQTTNAAIRTVVLAAAPIAIGTGLFPDIGVALFSRESFRPAEDNLRIFSVLIFLVYLTMPIGSAVLASGRQRLWVLVQCLCVVTSLVVDPWLVPIFQQRYGNGGLGLCIAAVLSEAVMVSFGIALLPAGVFDRKLRRTLLLTFTSGSAMIVAAVLARPLGSLIAATLAVATYAVSLRVTGAIDEHQMTSLMAAGQGFLQRFRPKESRK